MAQSIVSEIQGILQKLDFPAEKQEVVDHAKAEGAGQEVLDALQKLPNESFKSVGDILQKLPLSDIEDEVEKLL